MIISVRYTGPLWAVGGSLVHSLDQGSIRHRTEWNYTQLYFNLFHVWQKWFYGHLRCFRLKLLVSRCGELYGYPEVTLSLRTAVDCDMVSLIPLGTIPRNYIRIGSSKYHKILEFIKSRELVWIFLWPMIKSYGVTRTKWSHDFPPRNVLIFSRINIYSHANYRYKLQV